MRKYKEIALSLFWICFFTAVTSAQSSDFLVVKKHDHTIQSVFTGMPFSFSSKGASYSGIVDRIIKDSVYLLQYDIRRMPTRLGVYVLDTVAVYRLAFNYHDIQSVDRKRYGFDWRATGGTLFGTGSLLTILGAGSWLVTKKDTRYYARPEFVIGSAALAGIGFLLLKSNTNVFKIGKKYTLEYIRVK